MRGYQLGSFTLSWARWRGTITAHVSVHASKITGDDAEYKGFLSICPKTRGLLSNDLSLHSRSDGAPVSFNSNARRDVAKWVRDSIVRTEIWDHMIEQVPDYDRSIAYVWDYRIHVSEYAPERPIDEDGNRGPYIPGASTTLNWLSCRSLGQSVAAMSHVDANSVPIDIRHTVVRLHQIHGMKIQAISKLISLPTELVKLVVAIPDTLSGSAPTS